MTFEEWQQEHFAEPHAMDEECLEEAFGAGWDAAQEYFSKGGSFK